ncbi:PAS domain S-box protein, partial [bacterium]|nr:PAS domain S-box protein [bacterium]
MAPRQDLGIYRGDTARPAVGLVLLIGVTILLLASLALLPKLALALNYTPQSEALIEYLSAYLSFVLFFICLRRLHLQQTKDVLFLGVGVCCFSVLQILQVIVNPGFHELTWVRPSANIAIALDLLARIILGSYLLLAAINVNKRVVVTFRNASLIYLNGLMLLLFLTFCIFNFLPSSLFVKNEPTLLKQEIDVFAAVIFLVATMLSIRVFFQQRRRLLFWFALASIAGLFANIHLSSWSQLGDQSFYFGHALKVLSIIILLVGTLLDHFHFSRIDAAGVQSPQRRPEGQSIDEKNCQQLIERMGNGLIVVDEKGLLTYSNAAAAKLLKRGEDELKGKHLSLFLDPLSYEQVAIVTYQPNQFRAGYFEVDMVAQDNERIPVGIEMVRIIDEEGKYVGAQATISDTSARRKDQEQLQNLVEEKNRRLQIFEHCIEHSTEGMLITDTEGKITYVNQAFTMMTGHNESGLIGQDVSVLQPEPKSGQEAEDIWKSAQEGQVWRGEIGTKRRDGSHFVAELSVVPIENSDGSIGNYLWIERDVTRKKALEKSLEEYAAELTVKSNDLEAAKSYYETLIAGMSDILLVVDNDGNCTFLNDYGAKRLSLTAADLTKANLPIFFDDLKKLEKDYGTALKVEIKDFEAPIKTKDGEPVLCSWNARPLFDRESRRTGAMAVGRDITQHKRVQDELKENVRTLEDQAKEQAEELQVRINQLERLLEIQDEIRFNVDVDVILNKICDAVQALGWNRAVISLRNHQARISRPVAAIGLGPAELERVMGWRVPFEHTEKFLKEDFKLGNAYFVEHYSGLINEKNPYAVFRDLGLREEVEWHSLDALIVPIRTKDTVIGHISVDDPQNRQKPSLHDVRDLEILADQAALAIDNARLVHEHKESDNRNRLLTEVSQIFYSSLKMDEVCENIVQKGAEAVGEFCSLFLVDNKGQYLEPKASFHPDQKVVHLFVKGAERYRVPIGQGILSEIVTTGRTWVGSQPYASDPDIFAESPLYYIEQKYSILSALLVPVQVHDRRIGAMIHLRIKSKMKYKKRETELALDLADRAALAIENARLFKDASEKANQLEKANKLKSEFLANVSHELRTPLNAIITLSDILIRGIPGDLNAEQSKQIQIIQRSGRNLLNLISDILDLSKIEAGRLEPVYAVIPIKAIIEETVEHIRPLCVGKGLSLELEYTDDVPEFIYSDQDKVIKALTNILSNAVKFTQKGGIQVGVSVNSDASKLVIQITDTGVGIPKDRIEEIFQEFHQVDSSASRTFGGTGLGLAITRNVLTLIDGSVEVKSRRGQGSTFSVYVPLKVKPDRPQEGTTAIEPRFYQEPEHRVALESTDDRHNLDRRKRVILVVDDEQEAVYMIRQYLSRSRYQLIFPQNGEDVLELAKKYKPYAITLDLVMPKKSGWQVLKSLKQDAQTRNIPVIIISVIIEKERAFEMGAAEYMVKPFEPEKLIAFLEGLDSSAEMKQIVADFPRFLSLKRRLQSKMQSLWGRADSPPMGSSTVLLVDDDSDTQYAVRYILEEVGYTVFVANDGNEALQQAESIMPSMVLMDMMMPGMDGYQATEKMKKNNKLK